MGDRINYGYLDNDESIHTTYLHWKNNSPLSDIAAFIAINGYEEFENQIEAFEAASRGNSFEYSDEAESVFSGMLFYNRNLDARKQSSETEVLEMEFSYIVSNIDENEFEIMIYNYNKLKKKWKFKKSSVRKHLIRFTFSEKDTADYRAIYEKY